MWSEMEKYPCAHPRVKTGCNYVIRIVSCNKSPWNTTRAENAFKPAGSAIATATMRDLYSAKPWCVQLNLARVLEDNVYTRTQAHTFGGRVRVGRPAYSVYSWMSIYERYCVTGALRLGTSMYNILIIRVVLSRESFISFLPSEQLFGWSLFLIFLYFRLNLVVDFNSFLITNIIIRVFYYVKKKFIIICVFILLWINLIELTCQN